MIVRRILVFTLLLGGCGFLKRPDNQFYSLDTIEPEGNVPAVRTSPVGIDAIELPPGLDRRGIVIRGAGHRIEVRGTHQWTSSLEEMVMHTLAFDLANRLPEGMVILPGQAKPSGVVRSASVVFEDLAPGPDQIFVLDARWTLNAPGTPAVVRHERITVPMPSMESPQIAAAMSQALATLSERIAVHLRGTVPP
jgi:uncharacterized lipoprotein YmbA